ncbi:hypothetical protein [Henriciella marina]|uniref:hypothetical protein n=1 Tax=Henriciella marina TaxID=453851 RepID=UPI00036B11CC|nr:hypothetical protein [Henriciella marina]
MTGLIRLSLILRLAAIFALPLAILTAVILERSPTMVILIAAAMTAVRPVVLRAVKSKPPAWPSFQKLSVKFLGFTMLGGVLFVAFAGIGALFTEIDLESRLGSTDAAIIGFWAAFAAICLAIPVKLLDGVIDTSSHSMRLGPFGITPDGSDPADGGGEIIEGEVIYKDKPGDTRR